LIASNKAVTLLPNQSKTGKSQICRKKTIYTQPYLSGISELSKGGQKL
jgi:hypothetical protein